MKLTFLIRDLGHGGAQRQLVLLAKGLKSEGHEVSVLHFYDGAFRAELEAAGIQTICVGKNSRWDLLGFFFRLVRATRRIRPEILHGYLAESNLMALLLKPFCGFPRIVWGVRDSQTDAHLWGLLGRLSFRLNCLLARFADLIICNSKAGHDYYAARGYPRHRMHVIPNGIDTARFKPAPKSNSKTLIFGIVGRLSPMKDHATFLHAAALDPHAKFVIVGSGDAAYAQQMHELAARLGIADRVTWLPAQNDMPKVYASFDCLVNSSAFGEGFSNVIGEAMACGIPCIASDVGDSAWIIGDKSQIFPAENHEALAQCMLAFHPHNPRQRIVDEFSVEKLIERTSRLLATTDRRTGVAQARPSACAPVGTKSAQKSGGSAQQALHADHTSPAEPTRPTASIMWLTTGLGSGGAEMMLVQLILGLPNLQHIVISLTGGGKHADALRNAGIQIHSLDLPAGKPTLRSMWRLFKIVRRTKPDVLMGWMYHGCFAATIARFMRFKRIPILWNIRQSLYDLKLEKRGSALVIRSLASLSWLPQRITYNSQLSAKQHEAIGYRSSKTQLIPNGFDLTKWQPRDCRTGVATARPSADAPPPPRDHAQESGGSAKVIELQMTAQLAEHTQPTPLIGRFGRNAAMKDYATFIAAAKLITVKHPEAQFIIVGAETETLDVPPNIQLLGERHDLPELTASLNIAVSSSAFGEGFPNVVGEAMACAVPVVATDIGDTRWVMGKTGHIVPSRDPQALANACLEIIDSGITQDLAARQRIETHFSLTSALKQFENLLTTPLTVQPSHRPTDLPTYQPCVE
ncbi:MAG: glycosyltransferase [Prosthecobacter sp.]|uniref:glycosyltransferase n=1 Tax=Prosthecobacter sp. TaxID=1965333 RepID=UPI0039034E28